jgi:competence protein ComEC
MLAGGLDLRSDVLKCPHHGSRSSSTPDFLRAAAPTVAVIPVGLGNRYRFPHEEVLERYRALGTAVYRTDQDGAVEIRFERDGLWVRTAAHPEKRPDFFPAGSGGDSPRPLNGNR